jgi:hypothetical protein
VHVLRQVQLAQKLVWTQPMERLSVVGHVESHFGLFGDYANIDTREVHASRQIPQAQKLDWTHPMELLGDVGLVESHFGPFGDSVSVGA